MDRERRRQFYWQSCTETGNKPDTRQNKLEKEEAVEEWSLPQFEAKHSRKSEASKDARWNHLREDFKLRQLSGAQPARTRS